MVAGRLHIRLEKIQEGILNLAKDVLHFVDPSRVTWMTASSNVQRSDWIAFTAVIQSATMVVWFRLGAHINWLGLSVEWSRYGYGLWVPRTNVVWPKAVFWTTLTYSVSVFGIRENEPNYEVFS